MTNTLLKIQTLKEKLDRKSELCTLVVNNWLQEYDPEIEAGMWETVKETLRAYKKMCKKLLKLEETYRLSEVSRAGGGV